MAPMTLETRRYDKKLISAVQYAKMSDAEKAQFKKTRILPPQLGSNSFGYIEVTLKVPEYRPL